MSLRVKIILLFFTTAIVPFAVIATFVFVDIRTAFEKDALARVDTLATIQKDRALDLLKKYNLQLEQFETRLQLRQSLSEYNRTKNANGQIKIAQSIAEAKRGSANIKDIAILNYVGIVVASTVEGEIGKDYSGEVFFQKGKDKNDTAEFFKVDRDVYLHLVGPLYLDNDKIGVVVIDVKTDDLFGLFKDHSGLGETGSWGMAIKNPEGDGLVVVPGWFDTNSDSPLVSTIVRNSNVPLVLAIYGEEKIFPDIVNYQGKHVLAATRYIPEVGWGIGVTQDRAEVFAVSNNLANQLIFFSSLLVIFVGFLTAVIAQIITKPITSLTQAASKIAAGDLSVRVDVNSKDEIGKLADIFNQMSEKLEASYKDMEGKVRERTHELDVKVIELEHVEEIRENQLRAETELKNKERDFISVASHELQTPLALIRSYLSMIVSGDYGKVDGQIRSFLTESLEGANRLTRLVRDLLTTSKIDEGRMQLNEKAFDLSVLLGEAVGNFELKFKEKGLKLNFNPPGKRMVFADYDKTFEVVSNLIDNAVKFTKKGMVTVSVLPEDGFAKVEVSDTGIGIKARSMPHIFDKFYFTSASLEREQESTGLGLYIVKSLVDAMGGTIKVESKVNKGSKFTFTLPLLKTKND